METSKFFNNFETFFGISTISLYLLGFAMFFLTLLLDWLNPKRALKNFRWYVQEFIYTLISIILGIGLCFGFELSHSLTYVVAIVMGLMGSTIIRKFISKKGKIADDVVDKVEDKIKNV